MKEKLVSIFTEFPGVQLKVEAGKEEITISELAIKEFLRVARQYAEAQNHMKILEELMGIWKEKIVEFAKKYPGLRGIISKTDGFVLTVNPKERVSWKRDVLKKILGIVYSTVAKEEIIITISVPAGFQTKKGEVISEELLRRKIKKALVNLGIPSEELKKIYKEEIRVHVDEEKLEELIKNQQISLPEEAKSVEIVWAIKVNKL